MGAIQPHIRLEEGLGIRYALLPGDPARVIRAAEYLEEAEIPHRVGLVRSHDSFYTDREEEICRYWSKMGVLGADMETAALFTLGALRGLKTASILNNVVLCKGDATEGIDQYASGEGLCAQGERAEILTALNAFALLEAGL